MASDVTDPTGPDPDGRQAIDFATPVYRVLAGLKFVAVESGGRYRMYRVADSEPEKGK